MEKKELRKIPSKNYIILSAIVLVTFVLVYYLYMWYDAYQDSVLNRPILDKYMEVINYNELDDYLIESPNTIIYVSVLENTTIREFEKQFKKLFKENTLNRELLYMDVTNEVNNSKIRDKMVAEYSSDILGVPVIMIFEDSELKTVYNIEEHNYDVDELKQFINGIRFSEEVDKLG